MDHPAQFGYKVGLRLGSSSIGGVKKAGILLPKRLCNEVLGAAPD